MEKIVIFRQLGFKMAFFTSLVGILPLFIGLYFLFKSTESFIKDDVCNNFESIAQNTKEELCRFFCSCVTDIKVLAETGEMRNKDMSVDRKLSEMERVQNYYKRFEDITLVDTKGLVVTSTTYNYRGEWKSKKWFQEAIKGNVYVSDAHSILDPYKIVVAIAVPLMDSNGKVQAAIVGQLNMERIWELTDNITIGNTGFVTVVNDRNYIIAHPNKENLFKPSPFNVDKKIGTIATNRHDSIELIYNSDKYGFYSEYKLPRWQVIVAQEKGEALSSISRLKNNILYILIVSLFLVILISILVSGGVVKPVHTLIKGMANVSAGDLSYRLNVKSRDEIGLLGASFNDMISNLYKAQQEIQSKTKSLEDALSKINELNITLEKKVEERTRELKEKQYQLIQTSKLAAIGQLGAGVAHELNNPLAWILGYTQFMLNRISKENINTEEICTFKKYLQHIENGTLRCKEIVQNLLQFAKKSTDNYEYLDMNNVLNDALSLIERQLSVNNIVVTKNLEINLHLIKGNANQLQQVFTNIIVNAQHAMVNGGQLFISTRNNNGVVEVEFKDTGCGIAEEHKERIFEPFFTTKIDWKGTGLGLTICYDIIKNHNGDIVVNSMAGEGATFTVIMPVVIKKHDYC